MIKTITFKGIDFEVEYDYQPEEKPVYNYGDGYGYPGFNEEVDITSIKFQGVEFYDILENDIDEIESLILNKIINEDRS